MQYGNTVYRDHEDLDFFCKISPQNQLNIYLVTYRHDWLGLAKPNMFSDQP